MTKETMIVGVDTGGTFTDFLYRRGGRWNVHKRLSTPDNPARAVLEGVEVASGGQGAPMRAIHGSTVATNAILERKGVRTALVTNQGFEDVIAIGRQNRTDLYDLAYTKGEPIIPGELRFGVPGRISAEGEEIEPLDEEAVARVALAVRESGAESVAVCLLFSFLAPDHEKRVRAILEDHGLTVSVSHEVLAEFREFERVSTLAVNAYVSPVMTRYLTELTEAMGDNPLRVMQSNGGSISAATAMQESVRTILSGPAGGAVGAVHIGSQAGFERLISFDMGGTSTDVCLLDRGLPLTVESSISGYPVKVPMIDIHTVGAGGGSIASLDAGGALAVGPESAGADPGPVCYGKGERITVTDADLYLGRLVPEHFLGGEMSLDRDRLKGTMERLASEAGISPRDLAEGILEVANANMERAIRVISVERGHDPHDFALFSFGGAGGLHCAFLARALGMDRVLVPANPGILSAVGMVLADVIRDYSLTVMVDAAKATPEELAKGFGPMEKQGTADLSAEGYVPADIRHERFLDMRYKGQSFEIITPLDDDPAGAFELLHERTYGYRNPGREIEVVNLRLRSLGQGEKPEFPRPAQGSRRVPDRAVLAPVTAVFEGREHETGVLDRTALLPGNEVHGPAIFVEYSSTIVLPPWARARVDEHANLVMELE